MNREACSPNRESAAEDAQLALRRIQRTETVLSGPAVPLELLSVNVFPARPGNGGKRGGGGPLLNGRNTQDCDPSNPIW